MSSEPQQTQVTYGESDRLFIHGSLGSKAISQIGLGLAGITVFYEDGSQEFFRRSSS